MKKLLPLMALTLPLTACQGALYPWGGYESRLLDYYKAPSDETWTKDMQTVIADAEKHVDQSKTHKVAPGLYAEYGYMLMKKGGGQEALPYFRKERAAWPESAVFMTALERASEGKTIFNQPTVPPADASPSATGEVASDTVQLPDQKSAKPSETKTTTDVKPSAETTKTTSASTTAAQPIEAKPTEAKPETKSVEVKPAAPQPSHGKTK